MSTPLRALLALALGASGCTVDGIFFRPSSPTDGYDFDGLDPDLQGELTELHPSLIGAADRREGFVETEWGAIHWVFARREGATDAILYSHGNAAHLGRYWDRVERLHALGHHVLIYDYPGYGLSGGEVGEAGTFGAAQAALEVLVAQPEVERVWLYGYSLGGAPTYELAARAERGDAPPVRGVISEAAWCSAQEVLQDGTQVGLPGHFGTRLLMDSCARVGELASSPLSMMHGTEDETIPIRHLRLLRAAADDALEVTAHEVAGARHTDVPVVAGEAYDAWIRGFTGTP
ncbi:MAG: alpha/beta fold hydrolase [Sandaracinaceae bacterium]|nr:alpha/beta fold hydrolase [Sandaracinaceae bacterium]